MKARSYKLGGIYQPEGVARLFKKSQTKAATVQVQQTPTMQPATPSPVTQPPILVQIDPEAPSAPDGPQPVPVSASKQKAPKKKSNQDNDAAMAIAKEQAQICVRPTFMASMGWRDLEPGEYDEELMLAMPERDKAVAASWAAFERWRVEQRKAGRKLDNIYQKDSMGVAPIREAIVSQYWEFLEETQPENMSKFTGQVQALPQAAPATQVETAPIQPSEDALRRQEARRRAQEKAARARQAEIQMSLEKAAATGVPVQDRFSPELG